MLILAKRLQKFLIRRQIMIKTKIIETTEKYDKDGKLVEKITREETSEDDETRSCGTLTTNAPWILPSTTPCQERKERLTVTW